MSKLARVVLWAACVPACYGWTSWQDDGTDAHRRDDGGDAPDAAEVADDAAADGPCAVPDRDRDGDPSYACGGGDCNDDDPTIYSGAPDNAGRWSVHELPGDCSYGSGPVVGDDGTPRFLCWVSYMSPVLTLYSWVDERWTAEDVWAAPEGMTTDPTVLAAAPDGTLHAAWLDDEPRSSARLYHAVGSAGGEWRVAETVLAEATSYIQDLPAAVDASGRLHVAYAVELAGGARRLRHATAAGDGWDVEEVPSGGGEPVRYAMALDPSGEPHVLLTVGSERPYELRHAVRRDGAWTSEIVATEAGGGRLSLVFDSAGTALAVYGASDDRPFGMLAGGTWTFERIAEPAEGWFGGTSAVGADGVPQVAYFALGWDFMTELRLGRRTASGWVREQVRPETDSWYGDPPRMEVDATGAVHMILDNLYITNAGGAAADGIDQDCDGVDG